MSMIPRSPVAEKRQKLVRTLGLAISGLMVVLVLGIFAFIMRTESAHDEASCAFEKRGERPIGTALVTEEARRCLPEVEEHRWLLSRAGAKTFELGRKRLPADRFDAGRVAWKLSEDTQGKAVLRIEVDGALLSEFRGADSVP